MPDEKMRRDGDRRWVTVGIAIHIIRVQTRSMAPRSCCLLLLFLLDLVLTTALLPIPITLPNRRQFSRLESAAQHVANGIECREVTIDIQLVGPVTILEATAQSQEDLVDMALEMEEDEVERDNQLQSGDPYGAVLWPAASAIANHLLTNCSDLLEGATILELGTGTGLVSLAASLHGGCSNILATDYEPVPLRLLKYAQDHLNQGVTTIETGKQLNICMHFTGPPNRIDGCLFVPPHVDPHTLAITVADTALLDICDTSTPLPDADIVVAADIMYEPTTGRAMARRVQEALLRGSRVLVGDSPGRAGRPAFLDELNTNSTIDATFVDTVGQTCSGPRHDLICGKSSPSVSATPQDLAVAIMDLDPATCLKRT